MFIMLWVFHRGSCEDDFQQTNWEAIIITCALSSGQSVANKQHYRSLLNVFTSPFNIESVIRLLLISVPTKLFQYTLVNLMFFDM